MKKIIYSLAFVLIVHCTLTIDNCKAQWQPDTRLTTNTGNSWDPTMATAGQVLNAVWRDYRDGIWEIYFKRSTNNGNSWGQDIRLTNNAQVSYNSCQSIVYSELSLVHLIWSGQRDGNYEIYYKRSTDVGLNWGTDIRMTNNTSVSEDPSIAVSGQLVHIVWRDEREGNAEIYYKRSTDAGLSWGTDTRLTNSTGTSTRPSVTVSGSVIHIVWEDTRDGNSEIYYKRSSDGGLSWGTDIRLTNNPSTSYTNYNYAWCIASSGNVIHVVWWDFRDNNSEIYYKRSADGGLNWGTDIRMTNNSSTSEYPSVSASGLNVHILWIDSRDGNHEVYYKHSTDGGINWGADYRLTNNSYTSEHSSVTQSGSSVHVLWEDTRDGNWEIYYKRDTTGNPIGIKNINSEIPEEFKLYQNYPNPFNPTTLINFSVAIPSYQVVKLIHVKIMVYDILGREIATIVNEEMKPGNYVVEFKGNEHSSGIYYYQLKAGDYMNARKMILLK
jgi:hypothetical protein